MSSTARTLIGTKMFLVVTRIPRNLTPSIYSNYLVSAKDESEAVGAVRPLIPEAVVHIEFVASESENPALINAIRLAPAHQLSVQVRQILKGENSNVNS
jgi:hypothetical protein